MQSLRSVLGPGAVAVLAASAFLSSCSKQAGAEPDAEFSRQVTTIDLSQLPVWLREKPRRYAVDLRDPDKFARGHIRGAINLQSGYEQFTIRAQRFFPKGSQLALISEDPSEAERLAKSISARFPGSRWFDSPASRIAELGLPLATQKTIEPREAFAQLRKGEALLIDARTASEYAEGHAPSALFVYPDDFPRQLSFLRPDKTIIVVCEAGWRSSLLVSYMDHYGFKNALNLTKGLKGWREANLPVETGSEQRAFK